MNTHSSLEATLDAIAILERAYSDLLSTPDSHSVVRQILLRAKDRLSSQARAMLTGGI